MWTQDQFSKLFGRPFDKTRDFVAMMHSDWEKNQIVVGSAILSGSNISVGFAKNSAVTATITMSYLVVMAT